MIGGKMEIVERGLYKESLLLSVFSHAAALFMSNADSLDVADAALIYSSVHCSPLADLFEVASCVDETSF
jgi:hypothetical protein